MENANLWIEKPESQFYQIRLKGHLNLDWSEWFGGLTISQEENGETLLSGYICDQSALFGIFLKIQNLGITLLSVINTTPEM
jgi:hypothetical protein